MHIKIQKASPKEGGGDNKGSCAALATYLEHEDQDRLKEGKDIMPFLTPDGIEVTKGEVIDKIDRNHKHLGKDDYKFYSIIVSPSPEEIKAMGETEAEQYESGLKLMREISDNYAQSFNREEIKTASDLILFWKFHFTRGDNGDLQFHLHGIVSRNSVNMGGRNLKLSPMTTHRATEKGPVKGGFDRKEFFWRSEKLFDRLFHYDRKVSETFDYNNAMAHGTPEEKAEQAALLANESNQKMFSKIATGLARRRDNIKAENEAMEVAALLAQDNVTLPKPETTPGILEEVFDIANLRNIIVDVFNVSKSRRALELNLMAEGATVFSKTSPDGVEDLTFIMGSKKIYGKDIFEEAQSRVLLRVWEKLTGEMPAFKVRAARVAALEETRNRELKANASQTVKKITIHR